MVPGIGGERVRLRYAKMSKGNRFPYGCPVCPLQGWCVRLYGCFVVSAVVGASYSQSHAPKMGWGGISGPATGHISVVTHAFWDSGPWGRGRARSLPGEIGIFFPLSK